MRVFCIDGVVVETDHEFTDVDFRVQVVMPIENQPIMAGLLAHDGVTLLTPLVAREFADKFGGRMVEDRNTEMMHDVGEALSGDPVDWPW
jgi:hypothetical protein